MFPERFILGMGVSGGPFMKRHGIDYGKPLSHMREYLVRMREAPYYGPRPAAEPPTILAAFGRGCSNWRWARRWARSRR